MNVNQVQATPGGQGGAGETDDKSDERKQRRNRGQSAKSVRESLPFQKEGAQLTAKMSRTYDGIKDGLRLGFPDRNKWYIDFDQGWNELAKQKGWTGAVQLPTYQQIYGWFTRHAQTLDKSGNAPGADADGCPLQQAPPSAEQVVGFGDATRPPPPLELVAPLGSASAPGLHSPLAGRRRRTAAGTEPAGGCLFAFVGRSAAGAGAGRLRLCPRPAPLPAGAAGRPRALSPLAAFIFALHVTRLHYVSNSGKPSYSPLPMPLAT